jgi:glycosyltransferase involved in cell wall biosynthesis
VEREALVSERSGYISKVAVIGNYLPRQCGIATFTTDLVEAISTVAPDAQCFAVAMNDTPEGYRYPAKVRFEINQNVPADYSLAADFLNMNQIDAVCLQHEYGIFGGPAGVNILKLLQKLRMPVVTTLHTVLSKPSLEQKKVFADLADLSEKLVVICPRAQEILHKIYSVPEKKVVFIHHGIPDISFVDPSFHKDRFGVEGRHVILTFGLLSPSKGLEYMIKALPEIVDHHPDVVYIILGATHPHIKRQHGEEYRVGLQQLAKSLGVNKHVIFHNRFVEKEDLCEFLGSADIYVTPYLEEEQIASGTLAYAMGSGKAIVSTPYWYAQDMIGKDRGRIVPFRNHKALAEQVIDLLDNETKRHAMRKRAYIFSREAVWPEVAKHYLKLFQKVRDSCNHELLPTQRARTLRIGVDEDLPEINLDHFRRLTDDTGILQHATFTVPNRIDGYCLDDNARALIVAMMAQVLMPEDKSLYELCIRYLSFIQDAYNEKNGRFRNFMSFDRKWLEDKGSKDSHGRALWGLGMAVALGKDEGQIAPALTVFKKGLKVVETFPASAARSWAFALVGIHAYLRRFSGDTEAKKTRAILANQLFDLFKENATADWPWFEDTVTYANGKLPHALLLSGHWMQDGDMVQMGLKTLEWLLEIQTDDEGFFAPVGNCGWYTHGEEKAVFDQQPIEAHAMIEACIEAHNITREQKWLDAMNRCFNWFIGQNSLKVSLYNFSTGGCRDGLRPNGTNQNQGAESTLAWLLSLLNIYFYSIAESSEYPIESRKGEVESSVSEIPVGLK